MRFRNIVSILFFCLVWLGVAQDEDAPERRFSVMAYGDDFFEDILYESEGEVRELIFNPYRRSATYPLYGTNDVIRFFREIADEEGKISRDYVAEARLPEDAERGLLIFFDRSPGDGALPYRVLSIDESPGVFASGSFRFLNLTGAPLMVGINDKAVALPSGMSEVYSYDPTDRQPYRFHFAVELKDVWRPVFSTWRQSSESAGTLFILKPPSNPESLKIRVNALVETLR